MTDTAAKRVIKKYPNRRLYDTNESKYVTLADVRRLVLEDIPFCVIDKKSNEDITRNILLESRRTPASRSSPPTCCSR